MVTQILYALFLITIAVCAMYRVRMSIKDDEN